MPMTLRLAVWFVSLASFLVAGSWPLPAAAVQACDIDGVSVNPSHGGTTAGKTGLMRCRDSESGQLQREQELRNGVFMGVVRFYKAGVLEREHQVNEKGNRDGLSREYSAIPAATPGEPGRGNRLLREEVYRNGSTVGRQRTWFASGTLERVAMHGDDGREQASAEFTPQGKLRDLRCGPAPVLAPDADDATWCGHAAQAGAVEFFTDKGVLRARAVYERGERRRFESLWSDGKPSRVEETRRDGGSERRYAEDGTLRAEKEWTGAGRERRTTLEREHHESGKRVLEKRYAPQERGSQLLSEQRWYLNGQPREKQEFSTQGGQTLRRDTAWHDNGQIAFEGQYVADGRYAQQPSGTHKRYDTEGRLRAETQYDVRGKPVRGRELDEAGRVLRDDEVFEDGSRKSMAR